MSQKATFSDSQYKDKVIQIHFNQSMDGQMITITATTLTRTAHVSNSALVRVPISHR